MSMEESLARTSRTTSSRHVPSSQQSATTVLERRPTVSISTRSSPVFSRLRTREVFVLTSSINPSRGPLMATSVGGSATARTGTFLVPTMRPRVRSLPEENGIARQHFLGERGKRRLRAYFGAERVLGNRLRVRRACVREKRPQNLFGQQILIRQGVRKETDIGAAFLVREGKGQNVLRGQKRAHCRLVLP